MQEVWNLFLNNRTFLIVEVEDAAKVMMDWPIAGASTVDVAISTSTKRPG